MPAVSQAQRGYLNARFGHAWVKRHHFDNKGALPAHAAARTRARRTQLAPTVKRHAHRRHTAAKAGKLALARYLLGARR